ncbi:hypothetical protein [Jannaschia seohaensis]|uniref:Uncharacterized protein n=1 Tax=Jannaschia seohaensis TaxID=475081 RepID=A0A2Y9A109_9RHOB|nr:hypothetical protein [Jannaschia seohaensis]PWJ21852.1 hypothetical protein BCF38_101260 [Jannaschia seohaensis]SSA38130.1 hypothetical protein SAMN05421539_101260 [Jannaschia seohaensis]
MTKQTFASRPCAGTSPPRAPGAVRGPGAGPGRVVLAAALALLSPGAALAHGGHAPLSQAAHASAHGLVLGIALIAVAALVALRGVRDEG